MLHVDLTLRLIAGGKLVGDLDNVERRNVTNRTRLTTITVRSGLSRILRMSERTFDFEDSFRHLFEGIPLSATVISLRGGSQVTLLKSRERNGIENPNFKIRDNLLWFFSAYKKTPVMHEH